MSVTRVGSASAKSTVGTDHNATIALSAAGTLADGDCLHMFVDNNAQATSSTPSGWTLVRGLTDSTTLRSTVFRRFYVTGDADPVSVQGADAHWQVHLTAHRGVNHTSPYVDEDGVQEASGGLSTHAAPALTNTDAAAWGLFHAISRSPATPQSWTAGTGLTELLDVDHLLAGATNLIGFTADSNGAVATGTITYDATMTAASAVVTMWAALLRPNTSPTVDAGADLAGTTAVNSNRTASASDPEGDGLTYLWTADAGVTLVSGSTTDTLTFSATPAGAYDITCTVTDSGGLTDADTFTFTVSDNIPPVVNVKGDIEALVGEEVTRVAKVTDADVGDTHTYAWFADSVDVEFGGATDEIGATWHSDSAGEYEVTLEVNDGTATVTDSLTFTVLPSAADYPNIYVGPDATVKLGFSFERTVEVIDGGTYSVQWTAPAAAGIIGDHQLDTVVLLPTQVGLHTITCKVTQAGLVTVSKFVLSCVPRGITEITRIGSKTRTSSSFGTNVTIDLPNQIAPGDLLTAAITNNKGATLELPEDWVNLGHFVDGDLATDVFYHVAKAIDTTPVIALSEAADWMVQIMAHRGVDPSEPWDRVAGYIEGGSGFGPHNFPAVANANARGWAVMFAAAVMGEAEEWVPGIGMVRVELAGKAGTSGGLDMVCIAGDSREPAPLGAFNYGATTSASVSQATLWLGVLNPLPVTAPATTNPRQRVVGDSLAYGYGTDWPGELLWTEQLAALAQAEVVNHGVPGTRVGAAAAIQGGHMAQLSVVGGSIPAGRQRVEVTVRQDPDVSLVRDGRVQIASTMHGTLNGVRGVLDKISHETNFEPYYFTRDVAGSSVAVAAHTEFIADSAVDYRNDWLITWTGHNDRLVDNLDAIVPRFQEMADYVGPNGRYLFLGLSGGIGAEVGTEDYDDILAINEEIFSAHPDNSLDIRRYLIDEAMDDLGLPYTEQDIIDIFTSDIPPESLRENLADGSTGNHLNAEGQLAVARRVYRWQVEHGWYSGVAPEPGEDAAIRANPRGPLDFHLWVDWDNDGNYEHPLSDLSSYLLGLQPEREYATDQPSQVTLFDGYGTAQLRAQLKGHVLLPGETTAVPLADLFSPWNRSSPLYGTNRLGVSCYVDIGMRGYPPTRVFTGRVRTLNGDGSDKVVHLEALDLDMTLDRRVTLPPAVARYLSLDFVGFVEEGVESYSQIGLNTQWVIDNVLRAAGIYLTRPPRPLTYYSATFHGSMWPEVYNDQRPPWGACMIDSLGVIKYPVEFVDGPTALAVGSPSRAIRMYGNLLGDIGTIPGNGFPAQCTIEIGAIKSTGHVGTIMGLRDRSTLEYDSEVTGNPIIVLARSAGGQLTVRFQREGSGSDTDLTFTGPDWPDEQWVYMRVVMRFTGTRTVHCTMQVDNDTVVATPQDGTIGIGSGRIGQWGMSWNAGKVYLQDLHITGEGQGSLDRFAFTPAAVQLDVGLNELMAVPPTIDEVAREVIAKIAAAELATAGFDENGTFIFRNRLHEPDASTAVLAGDESVTTLRWSEDWDALRNRVVIPVTGFGIGDTSSEVENPVVWTAPEIYEVPANSTLELDVVFDKSIFVLRSATATGALTPDGSDGGAVILGITYQMYAAGRARLRILNGYPSQSVWMVDIDGRPTLEITGVELTKIPGAEVEASDDPSIDKYGLVELRLPDNPWRQKVVPTQALADTLVSETAILQPVLDQLQIIGDYRHRLGNVVSVQDRAGAQLNGQFRLQMIHGDAAAGAFNQTVRLRAMASGAGPPDPEPPDPPPPLVGVMAALPANDAWYQWGIVTFFNYVSGDATTWAGHVDEAVDYVLDIGPSFIRQRVPTGGTARTALASALSQLQAEGVEWVASIYGPTDGDTYAEAVTFTEEMLDWIEDNSDLSLLRIVYGPNEPNGDSPDWVDITTNMVRALSDVMRARPAWDHVLRGGPPLNSSFDLEESAAALGDLSDYIDVVDVHLYPGSRRAAYRSDEIVSIVQPVLGPGLPVTVTEGGYFTATEIGYEGGAEPTPEDTAALYAPIWPLDHLKSGRGPVSTYQLLDEDPDGFLIDEDIRQGTFGLVATPTGNPVDWTEKLSYGAMQNYCALFRDPDRAPGAIPGLGCEISATSDDGSLRYQLFHRDSDNRWLLALWRSVDLYTWDNDTDTGADINPGTIDVVITLDQTRPVSLYEPSTGGSAVDTFSESTFLVGIGGGLVIAQIG